MTTCKADDENATACENQWTCRLCGSDRTNDFFEARDLPVWVCVLGKDANEARQAPRGDIVLNYCQDCGFVQNRLYDTSKLAFAPGYEASLSHSETFKSYISDLTKRLVDRYQLRGKRVTEIGCGDGYFLSLLCEYGACIGTGFDPTAPEVGTIETQQGSVELVRDYYSSKYADVPCDFLCCLSVLEDIEAPTDFMTSVKHATHAKSVPGYYEVFNAFRAFEAGETWSIHYEQCNYFGEHSFRKLFQTAGFELLDSGTCYGNGQYTYVEARPESIANAEPSDATVTVDAQKVIREFSLRHQKNIETWERRCAEFARDDRRAVLWGSGGKGISFLNMLSQSKVIEYVVDINPNRQGRYIPGTGQKIIAPEFLQSYKPDVVILSNQLYQAEISQLLCELGLSCEILIA